MILVCDPSIHIHGLAIYPESNPNGSTIYVANAPGLYQISIYAPSNVGGGAMRNPYSRYTFHTFVRRCMQLYRSDSLTVHVFMYRMCTMKFGSVLLAYVHQPFPSLYCINQTREWQRPLIHAYGFSFTIIHTCSIIYKDTVLYMRPCKQAVLLMQLYIPLSIHFCQH